MALVFYKSPTQPLSRVVDLVSLLPTGASIASAAIGGASPFTNSPLVATVSVASATSVTVNLSGGDESITYGMKLAVTLNVTGQTEEFTLAVCVQTDLLQPFVGENPMAFQALVGEVKAGDAANASSNFVVPPGIDASAAMVFWELISPVGELVSMGNCYETQLLVSQFATTVAGQAIVHVPSSATPSLNGEKYTLRWTMTLSGQPDMYSFESITVLGLTTDPLGTTDLVEIQGDTATAVLVTDIPYESVSLDVFSGIGNLRLSNTTFLGAPQRSGSGWLYSIPIDTLQLPATLAPYVLSWKYGNSRGPSMRETARLFVVNPSMLNAIEDCRAMVNRARTTLFQFADTLFDTQTITSFLRRGMDMFNAAGGLFTSFDMTDATGAIRDYWLGYSEVAMLQAQSLAEGEKAFDFQGQAIQLNVDRTQYYDKLAADISSRLEANVRPLKQNLQMKGVNGGSGNLETANPGNRGYVGITVTPVSGFGRYWNQARIR